MDAFDAHSDPGTISLRVVDPSGITRATLVPVKTDVGEYALTWMIPIGVPVGTWTVITTEIDGTASQTETFEFTVQ